MMRYPCLFILLSILITACTFSPTVAETQAACQSSKIQKSQEGFLEIQADMKSDGEAWALLFFETARTGEDEKIVWRITGESDEFQAQAQSEDGTIVEPIWMEYHGGSNWQRPGQEWGTGFNFPTAGCWTITVSRDETIGMISLDVLPP